jgi:leucyl aminopeptidase
MASPVSLHLVEQADALPLYLVTPASLEAVLAGRGEADRAYAAQTGFRAEPGSRLVLPGAVLVGIAPESSAERDLWALGDLPDALPPGTYKLADSPSAATATRLALGWALGAYAFTRYKKRARQAADLVWPENADRDEVTRTAEAIHLGRDLVNTPAGDLGPAELADAALTLARKHGATISVITGDELLRENYPAIHAVGRASAKPPCLIDLTWGKPKAPKVTLVGKGVCFDSGGLDLKPSSGMLLMKKDMGGAAAVLAVASMIMAAGLKVRLRVLIPAVENMVSGNAFRPLDVLPTRAGKTVEVGNTDAEGRLILCDALAEAVGDKPGLLIDCATLTGAARVALGPEVPAFFTRQDDLAAELDKASANVADPLWRLPLWAGYRKQLDSKVADLSSTGESSYNGAITAALFLAEFVPPETRWLHLDMMAWNTRTRPGRPEGGEAHAVRALFELVRGHLERA